MNRNRETVTSRREWMRASGRAALLAASAAVLGVAWTRRGNAPPAACPDGSPCGGCRWRAECLRAGPEVGVSRGGADE